MLVPLNKISLNSTGSTAIGASYKQSKYIKVYSKPPDFLNYGKTNISHLRGKTGVYFIKEKGKLVYIGSSTVLYNRIMRHFQDGRRDLDANYYTRFDNNKYTISYIIFEDEDQAYEGEQELIGKFKPRDNKEGKGDKDQSKYTDGVDFDYTAPAPF